jgi:hypothetical protein
VFHFSGPTGSNLQGTDITVPLQGMVDTWYANPQSLAVGSQFGLVQNFAIQGDASKITNLTVVITNAIGNSAVASVTF